MTKTTADNADKIEAARKLMRANNYVDRGNGLWTRPQHTNNNGKEAHTP